MKSILSLLGCLLAFNVGQSATVTVSNYNDAFNGLHGIADSTGALLSTGAGGVMGRMTLTDLEIAEKVAAGDISSLVLAFQPFDPVNGAFTLNNIAAGAFESSENFDTRASINDFGGSPIFVWLYKGASRAAASEYLLVKLNSDFPTDPEDNPPAGPVMARINPINVETLFAGTSGPQTHTYISGEADEPIYKMRAIGGGGGNLPPLAVNGTLSAVANVLANGSVTADDPEDDTLTYAVVDPPDEGVLVLNTTTGTYTYKANIDATTTDSFTFKANDGTSDSNVATISIDIAPPPPNSPPVAEAGSTFGRPNALVQGFLVGTDADNDPLSFIPTGDPVHGTVTINPNGTFSYRPDAGFLGSDSFMFKVNDGQDDSEPAAFTVVIRSANPEWTWMDGANVTKQKGVYGVQGSPDAANTPGARSDAAGASMAAGDVCYLFGGTGFGESTGPGALNDLWNYNAVTHEWTWMDGGKATNTGGVYGTKGTADEANAPGARSGASLWVDDDGNLWLFGGTGRDSSTTGIGVLNDLWIYDRTTGHWTWLSGANTINANGTYGTQGTPSGANTPGARSGAVSWTDPAGNLWLFGGKGRGATGTTSGNLNDLWRYDVATREWTWMKGGSNLDASGVYGAQGTGTTTTLPGARTAAIGWPGSDGSLWLFGGNGRASTAATGNLNDLWKYDLLSNQWTWIKGSNAINGAATYGTLGLPAAANTPGARAGASAWRGPDASLLLFGGQGTAHFSDVWRFDPEEGTWAWVKGPSTTNGAAVYGTKESPSPSGTPGSRRGAVPFSDSTGDLWLFGGTNAANSNNDVWRLDFPNVPVVRLLPITNITSTSADVAVDVNPNGTDTFATLTYIKVAGNGDGSEIELGAQGNGTVFQGNTGTLESLEPGSLYAVFAQAESAAGRGASIVRLFSTLGASPAVTVSFEEETTPPTLESAGTVNFEVLLSGPAPAAFTLPFTLSGTATAGAAADYTATTSPLVFNAGQLTATISIAIRDDTVLEPVDETVIMTLGTPVGAAVTLGVTTEQTLAIADNDAVPEITDPPDTSFVAVGGTVTFFVQATSALPQTFQWKKNGTKIAGATAASYTIPSALLTSAGNYTVEVKNVSGTAISAQALLYVVDQTTKNIVLPAGGSTTLTPVYAAPPGAPALIFDWWKDDSSQGISTKTLPRTPLVTGHSGVYQCLIRDNAADEDLFSGRFNLSVTNARPVIATGALPAGSVGTPYSHQIIISNLPGGAATNFTVAGLPAGLKVDAVTGVISGIPTAAATNKVVTISARNTFGTSDPVAGITITIHAVPPAVVGTYVTSIDRSPLIANNLGGRLDITANTAGTFTAKLTLGTTAISAVGKLNLNIILAGPGAGVHGVATFPRNGLSTLRVSFELGDDEISGELEDPQSMEVVPFGGVRNPWHATNNKATDYSGYFTYSLRISSELDGAFDIPQGAGFGSCTVLESGVATYAGRTADGGSFTVATIVGADGDAPFYAAFAGTPGSMECMPWITVDGGIQGSLTWNKAPSPAASKERAYRAGFEPIQVVLVGGKYVNPAKGDVVMDLPNNNHNAVMSFLEGGLAPDEIPALTFNIRNNNPNGTTQTITVPVYNAGLATNPNPAKITVKLDAKPVGQFSGGFTLPGAVTALNRTATYQGMIVRAPAGTFEAVGFFLLAMPPEPGETVSTSPVLSGRVTLLDARELP